MAILKCKMCGGTLEYDRVQNLAVCPYCGSKSTVFEQDRKLFEQFQRQFAALLNQEQKTADPEGFWVEASREELTREDGEIIEIAYLTKRKVDLCTMYVARRHVLFVFEDKYSDYAERYREMTGRISYPAAEMERELSRYVPKVVTECRLADGSRLLAIEKGEGVYPLKMLGTFIGRHAAWVMSRLENLCCLLEYNDMVLNAFTVDNLFVDPGNHQIHLYGGWWFAGFRGAENSGASGEVMPYLEQVHNKRSRNRTRTDLESIRLVAAKLLGYPDREALKADGTIPEPFRDFLLQRPEKDARADFKKWDRVLIDAYGERKFIPFAVTEEEVYSKSGEEE